MGIARGHDQGTFAQPQVALPQSDTAILGGFDQKDSRFVIEPGVGGIGNGFLLHRGIDVDPLHVLLGQLVFALGGLQRLAEQMLQAVWADAFAPEHQ